MEAPCGKGCALVARFADRLTAGHRRSLTERLGHWVHRRALARQGRRGVDALVADLDDPSRKVRCRAANSLWGLWEEFDEAERERALSALRVAARSDVDGPTRGNAVGAIVANGASGAIDLGVAALDDPDWVVRAIVASALGNLRDRRIVDALIPLLEDPESWVRTAAAYSLGWQADPRTLDPLRVLARERRDVEVRKAAKWAVRHIETKQGGAHAG